MSSRPFIAIFSSALLVAVLGSSTPAAADNAKLNLHVDLGFGSGIAGPLAPPGKNDKLAHIAPYGWASLDYEIKRPIAIEAIGGVGYLIDLESEDPDVTENLVYNIGVGVRLRFLNDDSGYKKEGGKVASNLWTSAHVAFHKYDGSQFGIDGAVGYEFSLVRPFQLGVFLRAMIMFAGDDSDHYDAAAFAGLSFGFDLWSQSADSDGDGLTDAREERLGTDPNNADTDDDGLPDGLEVSTKTDPNNADTDYDGVPDGIEDTDQDGKVDDGETDPRKGAAVVEDTDTDGVPDGQDKCADTPPGSTVNNQGCIAFEGKSFALEGVNFRTGSAVILKSSMDELRRAVQVLRDNPDVKVEIAGHTDDRGRTKSNLKLSQRRAEAVKAHLEKNGIDPARLSAKGYGESRPIKTNKTKAGRAANRRIEFVRQD